MDLWASHGIRWRGWIAGGIVIFPHGVEWSKLDAERSRFALMKGEGSVPTRDTEPSRVWTTDTQLPHSEGRPANVTHGIGHPLG